MVLSVNEQVETIIKVLDSNGDPGDSKTILYRIFDDTDSQFETGIMTEIGSTAIYTRTWMPDAMGRWMFEAYSNDPKFFEVITYNVSKDVKRDFIPRTDIYDDRKNSEKLLKFWEHG